MTPDEYQRWLQNSINGHNDYIKSLGNSPNKNEMEFMNMMNSLYLTYSYLYYNKTIHPDFEKLFPYNPIKKTGLISPYHQWDFIVYGKSSNILIDIDGSIHSGIGSDYYVTDSSGVKFKLKDYIAFNDSKRPYQTDGLDAYIVACYDDNLTPNTPVCQLNSDFITDVETLMNMLLLNTMDSDDINKLFGEAI